MDEASLDAIARLHVESLPDSVIGMLGGNYVRAFYGYLVRSKRELLAVARDAAGKPVGAAVVTLEPGTLNRRLLTQTPLVRCLAMSFPKVAGLARSALRGRRDVAVSGPAYVATGAPQLILLYTAAAVRGRGHGTALLHDVERQLRARRIARYEVLTEADPSNRALAFYERRGFEPSGIAVRFGTPFQVFRRSLRP